MAKIVDMVGFKNDIWEVLSYYGMGPRSKRLWLCRCFCGNEVIRKTEEIKTGRAKSCGCYKQSRPGNKHKHDYHTKHGDAKNTSEFFFLYQNWSGIKQRCNNPNHVSYKFYGGKGIRMCKEWESDYLLFKKWCLDNGWYKGMTLDRLDASNGYSPDNCRIITKSENSKGNGRKKSCK